MIESLPLYVLILCVQDANYRVCSIIAVGVFGDSPINWPPLVGRMADNYTLRNFWG